MRICFAIAFLLSLFSAPLFAAESDKSIDQILNSIDYPELQVVPRASERVAELASQESKNWWHTHWTFMGSGLMTLLHGLQAEYKNDLGPNPSAEELAGAADDEDDFDDRAKITTGIGLFWLVSGGILMSQRPYQSGLTNVRAIKGNGKRDQLYRERVAERALVRSGRLVKRAKYVSIVTNVAANAILLDDEEGGTGTMLGALGIVSAFMPLFFDHSYSENLDEYRRHKREIYRPIARLGVGQDTSGNLHQQVMLSWAF